MNILNKIYKLVFKTYSEENMTSHFKLQVTNFNTLGALSIVKRLYERRRGKSIILRVTIYEYTAK